jgi:ubiquinone/menaquinone biosynthesis C-methylase UbiE
MQTAAKKYSDKSFWQREEGLKLIEQLKIDSGAKVLDVGCGTGELTLELQKKVGAAGSVVGVDPDQSRLELAKTLSTPKNISWINSSIDAFNDEANIYDSCYSNCVLHWIEIERQNSALEKIYTLLKPGGKIGFTVIAYVPHVIQGITRLIGNDSNKLLTNFYTPSVEQWQVTLESYDFEVALAERYSIEVNYGKLNDFFDWWEGTSHGVFTPDKILKSDLEALKKMYPDDLIVDHPLIKVIGIKRR